MPTGSGLMSSQSPKQERFVHQGKGGVAGEVGDLRRDIENELASLAALALQQYDTLDIADVDALVETPVPCSTADQTIELAQFDGVVGLGVMDPPRNPTLTSDAHADHDAVDLIFTGTDIDDNVITETITKTADTGATDVCTKAFKTLVSVFVPAESGTTGVMTVGFGDLIGLPVSPLALASLAAPALIHEVADNAVVTNGVLTDGATIPPYGTYAPNGGVAAAKYAIIYPYDPAA